MLFGITINREGQFSVRYSNDASNQCGLKGTMVLNYKVKIVGDSKHLNEKGFIVDNNDIHDYFVGGYLQVVNFESCEKIAMDACEELKRMCEDQGAKVHAIDVTISGNPNAGLTASWRAPKPTNIPKWGF